MNFKWIEFHQRLNEAVHFFIRKMESATFENFVISQRVTVDLVEELGIKYISVESTLNMSQRSHF